MKYLFYFILFLLLTNCVHAFKQDVYPFDNLADAKRFEILTKQIRCVVCQNQNLADSNAPLANDLREKVYHLVKTNKSNDEIKDYLVKRYGEFILLQPRVNSYTIFLWGFPLISIAVSFWFLFRRAGFKV